MLNVYFFGELLVADYRIDFSAHTDSHTNHNIQASCQPGYSLVHNSGVKENEYDKFKTKYT